MTDDTFHIVESNNRPSGKAKDMTPEGRQVQAVVVGLWEQQ